MCSLLLATSSAHAQTPPPDSSIAGLYAILARIDSHPMLFSGESQIEAARRRIAQKSSLANPMLMLGAQNLPTNSFRFSEEPMTSKMIGISQSFPYPGKLKFDGKIAAQDTLTAQDDLQEARNMLARDVKLAYFDLYHLDQEIAVNKLHQKALDDLIPLAESKLATGSTTQSQVLDLKLERATLATEIIEERTMLRERAADLEQASGSPAAVTMTSSLGLPPFTYSVMALDSIARANRPTLKKLEAQIEQDRLIYRRNDLDKYPDFQVSLAYMQRDALSATSPMNPMNFPGAAMAGVTPSSMSQTDMVSATVSVELPFNFGGKRTEALAESDAMRAMKVADARAEELNIHTAIETNLAKLQGIQEEYTLLRNEIYPAVQLDLQTDISNYTYGKANIDDIIRTQLGLFHREHDRYRLEAEYNKAIAMIEFLTGTTLTKYTSRNDWK
ncbi:MAG: TolC family protein [Bacteroidota bacterium]|nr:TolC family protein [Bacteroidota bacterium]MDP4233242.1 TolC family protein [Bacteroidota bacterium]MDP4287787.1 TolC family protein [Bacteroidota bacterium]